NRRGRRGRGGSSETSVSSRAQRGTWDDHTVIPSEARDPLLRLHSSDVTPDWTDWPMDADKTQSAMIRLIGTVSVLEYRSYYKDAANRSAYKKEQFPHRLRFPKTRRVGALERDDVVPLFLCVLGALCGFAFAVPVWASVVNKQTIKPPPIARPDAGPHPASLCPNQIRSECRTRPARQHRTAR